MRKVSRRELLSGGAAILGGIAIGGAASRSALANNHPHPHQSSLDYLDPATYVDNCEVHLHLEAAWGLGGKSQMMAIGKRRLLFNNGSVWDVSDALHPALINQGAWSGSQLQLAYNRKIRKWILMIGASPRPTSATPEAPDGKYGDPRLIDNSRYHAGLRGVRIYDASNPEDIRLLSMWS